MFLCILYVLLGWKHGYFFFFLQNLGYFTTNRKNTVIQLTQSVRSKNFGKKTLKTEKNHLNCADLSIFFSR